MTAVAWVEVVVGLLGWITFMTAAGVSRGAGCDHAGLLSGAGICLVLALVGYGRLYDLGLT